MIETGITVYIFIRIEPQTKRITKRIRQEDDRRQLHAKKPNGAGL
jgi:hypothetical protein